ncbi:alpha/beta hydrolase [Sandarakinorhabdus sp. AAP62]|uniref:alpha/beta fold hydrolase n=1 Tax=Sandarakinorhabdus sp. AAP62 TaxID=1248916 RepID=UPI00187CDB6F|nr:alpha/beta hydrolase [Sandarakinorhabdus sp. AAP62]
MAPSARVDGAFAAGRVHRVAVPGGDLVAEVAGTGPAIILLHGWTLDRRQWRGQAPLADRFTLVAVDRRGFGESTAPADLADEPADVARVAAALGLARYHLVGLSQGGKVALAHAATRPAGLARMVVIGAPIDAEIPVPPETVPAAAMAALARAGKLAEMRQLWLAHPLTAGRPEVRAAMAAMLVRYDGRDLVTPGRPLTVTLDDVRRITVKATALAGADDTPWRRAVVDALGEAGLATGLIRGGGHLAPLDAPAATNAAIMAALA